ncbi:RNA polymerase subunit sigma, partial [Streptomyces sp. NPDC058953]
MTDVHAVVGAVWKQESARIVAGLTRLVHDVGIAEESAQEALVSALEKWPVSGVPENPGAWLTAVAPPPGGDTTPPGPRPGEKTGGHAHPGRGTR